MASSDFTFRRRKDDDFSLYRAYDVFCPGEYEWRVPINLGVVYLDMCWKVWIAVRYEPGPVPVGEAATREGAAWLLDQAEAAAKERAWNAGFCERIGI